MKDLFIAEKPSVAAQFAEALGVRAGRSGGCIEDDKAVITWCVGHLVKLSYPEKYDMKYKRWSLETLPFLPETFLYEVIEDVRKQFDTVSALLNRPDVGCIYICTDSGREGEYIYRLVDMMAGVSGKPRRRVWIDSQTKDEILRGIREAKDWSAYDGLSASAFLRAKEDYLMGINFSRLLTLKYGYTLSSLLGRRNVVISVGRVMTCVLGMVVRREREIRSFVKTPFYRVLALLRGGEQTVETEWKVCGTSLYYGSPKLYKENGFRKREDAQALAEQLEKTGRAQLIKKEKKKETKNPPLLYNLAELQNYCSKLFKISPDETLNIVQELYEKKLVTYPRTDARVLSTAVAKEIDRNLKGLVRVPELGSFAQEVLDSGSWKGIAKSRYTNDSQITDHYALIPTGQGQGALQSLTGLKRSVYELIGRRFLSIFYPAAVYEKLSLEFDAGGERLTASFRTCLQRGWLDAAGVKEEEQQGAVPDIRKDSFLDIERCEIKEGETTPPKRYTSGSMILAMENAGQLIEDEELREQIRGSGIGTSATRAEILKKLVTIKYLALNGKTQVITPTLTGEMVFEVVAGSMPRMLDPEMTASWEKGLTYVAEGSITPDEYMEKLTRFVAGRVDGVKRLNDQQTVRRHFDAVSQEYKKRPAAGRQKSQDEE